MNRKEELESALLNLDNQLTDTYKRYGVLKDELKSIQRKELIESGILSRIKYKVKNLDNYPWIYAEGLTDTYNEPKELFSLCPMSGAFSLFGDDLEIQFGDGEFYLRFKDFSGLAKFSKKLNLDIDISPVIEKLESYKKRYEDFKLLVEELESKE